MTIDDTDTNPGAAPEAETEVAEPDIETEGSETEAPEEEANPDDELEEFEHEGKKASIPKWLKPQLMMQADYTKKTQSHAEAVKAWEANSKAQEAAIAQRQQAFHADVQEWTQLTAMDAAIKQYEQINFAQLQQQDPNRAAQLYRELQEMRHHASRLSYGLQQKQQQRSAEAEREHANRLRERDTVLTREISGFSPALMSKIEQYAISDGYTSQEAQSLIDPRYVKTLNKARMWDEYQAKAKAAAKQAKQKEEPAVAPTPTVQAKKPSNSNRLRDDLSAEEWVRRREAQLRARG